MFTLYAAALYLASAVAEPTSDTSEFPTIHAVLTSESISVSLDTTFSLTFPSSYTEGSTHTATSISSSKSEASGVSKSAPTSTSALIASTTGSANGGNLATGAQGLLAGLVGALIL